MSGNQGCTHDICAATASAKAKLCMHSEHTMTRSRHKRIAAGTAAACVLGRAARAGRGCSGSRGAVPSRAQSTLPSPPRNTHRGGLPWRPRIGAHGGILNGLVSATHSPAAPGWRFRPAFLSTEAATRGGRRVCDARHHSRRACSGHAGEEQRCAGTPWRGARLGSWHGGFHVSPSRGGARNSTFRRRRDGTGSQCDCTDLGKSRAKVRFTPHTQPDPPNPSPLHFK